MGLRALILQKVQASVFERQKKKFCYPSLNFGKEDTLLILLSAWDRSRDSTAKRNLSKDMSRTLVNSEIENLIAIQFHYILVGRSKLSTITLSAAELGSIHLAAHQKTQLISDCFVHIYVYGFRIILIDLGSG